jgi:hypothetical protein
LRLTVATTAAPIVDQGGQQTETADQQQWRRNPREISQPGVRRLEQD